MNCSVQAHCAMKPSRPPTPTSHFCLSNNAMIPAHVPPNATDRPPSGMTAGFSMPAQVYGAVDRINVMTYDYPFAGLEEVTSSVDTLIDSGIPSEKLFLGIPAYGRHQQNVGNVMTFAEIVDAAGTHVVERVRGPWSDFKYDSPSVVQQKVRLAKEKKLGGVFMWELGQDKQLSNFPGGVLLEAMHSEAEKHEHLSDEL